MRDGYPGVKILAVATHVAWMQKTISEVVEEENSKGHHDLFYASYPYYEGGYVNDGHPNVETHYKIADELIAVIDAIDAWEPYIDTIPPTFIKLPESPFTVYDTLYTLNIETDSYASVRFSSQDKSYGEMENEFTTTGKRDHSVNLSCEQNYQYTYYLRAADLNGNVMDTSAVITFDVDTTKRLQGWLDLEFNDADWEEGMAPLGFGNITTEATEIAEVQTAYFRKWFQLDDVASLSRLSAILKYDNGGIVYVNGTEIGRVNMEEDEIEYDTEAINSANGNQVFSFKEDDFKLLKNGMNLIAVEIHQMGVDNTDLFFDLMLRSSQVHIDYGSTWNYHDSGDEPVCQLVSTGIENVDNGYPSNFQLLQNYPNPFNASTRITYYIPVSSKVRLKIYDILGRRITTLIKGKQPAGSHTATFDGSQCSSGLYICVLEADQYIGYRKMMLMK